jgi:hypothetical protein
MPHDEHAEIVNDENRHEHVLKCQLLRAQTQLDLVCSGKLDDSVMGAHNVYES